MSDVETKSAEPTPRRSRRRRALRWFVRIVLGLFALILLVMVSATLWLRTDHAGETICEQVALAAQPFIDGSLEIGSCSVSVSGAAEIRDIVVKDQGGESLATVHRLFANVSLRALLSGEIRVTELSINLGAITVDRLSEIILPPEEDPEETGPPPPIYLDSIVIEGGPITVANLSVSELLFRASANIVDGVPAASISTLSFQVDVAAPEPTKPGLSAQVAVGGASLEGDQVVVTDLGITPALNGETGLRFPLISANLAAETASLTGRIRASVADTATLLDRVGAAADLSAYRGTIDLQFNASGPFTGPWSIRLNGDLADAALEGSAVVGVDPLRAELSLSLRDLTPRNVTELIPPGTLDLVVRARALVDGDRVSAAVGATARGQMAGIDIDLVNVGAATDGSRVAAVGVVSAAQGNAFLWADSTVGDGELTSILVHRLHLESGNLNLKPLAQSAEMPVGGKVHEVELRASGPLTALDTHVGVLATAVSFQSFSAGRLRVNGDATLDVPALTTNRALPSDGDFDVTAENVADSGSRLGNLKASGSFHESGREISFSTVLSDAGPGVAPLQYADIQGKVLRQPRAIQLSLRRLLATVDSTRWSGSGSVTLADSGQIIANKVRLNSELARIAVDGTLPAAGSNDDSAITVTASEMALDRFVRFAPTALPPDLRGKAKLDLTLRRSGSSFATVAALRLRGVRALGRPRVDVDLDLDVAPGAAAVRTRATSKGTGTVVLDLAARAPDDLLDVDAWKRLSPADIRPSHVTIDRLRLGALEKWAVIPIALKGTVNADVEVDGGGRNLGVRIAVAGDRIGPVSNVDTTADITWSQDGGRIILDIHQGGEPLLSAEIGNGLGLDELLAGNFGITAAPLDGNLEIYRFPLPRLHALGLVAEPIRGHVSLSATVAGSVDQPRIERLKLVADEVAVRETDAYRIELDASGDSAAAGLTLRALPTGGPRKATPKRSAIATDTGCGTSGITADKADTREGEIVLSSKLALKPEPVIHNASLRANNFDLALLQGFFPAGHPLSESTGLLNADFETVGEKATPQLKGRLWVANGQIVIGGGQWRLTNVGLQLQHDRDLVRVECLTADAGGGELAAVGRVKLNEQLLPEDLTLELRTERFPLVQGSLRFLIDLIVDINVKPNDGEFLASARLTSSKIKLERTDKELQALGDLEDVEFTDAEAERIRSEEGGATPFPPIKLSVTTDRPIQIDSEEAQARLNVDLNMLMKDLAPSRTTGEVAASPGRGKVKIFEREYTIARAVVRFDGDIANPKLDILLRREFPSGEVKVAITGRANDFDLELSDSEGRDETQVLAVMTGQDPNDSEARSQGAGAAGGAVGTILAGTIREYLPVKVDVLRVYPDGAEVGQWFFNGRMLASYRYRSVDAQRRNNSNEVKLEWHIIRHVLFEVRYGDRDIGNADLLWIYRF